MLFWHLSFSPAWHQQNHLWNKISYLLPCWGCKHFMVSNSLVYWYKWWHLFRVLFCSATSCLCSWKDQFRLGVFVGFLTFCENYLSSFPHKYINKITTLCSSYGKPKLICIYISWHIMLSDWGGGGRSRMSIYNYKYLFSGTFTTSLSLL